MLVVRKKYNKKKIQKC